jgi:hypothetical protein
LRLGEADSDDKYIAIANGNFGNLQRIRGKQDQAGRHDAQINLSIDILYSNLYVRASYGQPCCVAALPSFFEMSVPCWMHTESSFFAYPLNLCCSAIGS